MNDIKDLALMVLLPIFAGILLFGGSVALMMNAYGRYQCRNFAEQTGIHTQWKTLDVCYVQTPRGWQRYDEYIARSVTNEAQP
jgi:hypothetical protein